MRNLLTAIAITCSLATATVPGSLAAEASKQHRISIQVDQNDADIMNLVLNNTKNVIEYYRDRGEELSVEVVAYGPGLHMLRDDTSPVKDRIKQIMEAGYPAKITFAACNNTKHGMEKREGHAITIIPIDPSGVVRLMELQEQGWSYVRP